MPDDDWPRAADVDSFAAAVPTAAVPPAPAALTSGVSLVTATDLPTASGSAGNPSGAAGPGRGPLRDAVADRLPATLRGAAVAPSRRAVAGLALVALAVVAATGWLALRNGPQPTAVGTVARSLPSSTASAGPAKALLVDVAGKVRRPGVVSLPLGSRVADALRAAGGVRPGVDIGLLNLARPLTDGEQVIVGLAVPGAGPAVAGTGTGPPASGAGSGGAGSAAGSPVNLNLATTADLDGLPGVGPVLAQRIVDWRTAHGPFTSVDQLREVSGIGDRRFQDLKDLVRV